MMAALPNSDARERVVERELGPGELLLHLLHKESPPLSTYLHTVIFTNRTKVEIREDDIRKTLQIICKYQPLLSAKLVEEKVGEINHVYLRQMSDSFINIKTEHIKRKEEWVDLARNLLLTRFNVSDGALWQVCFLKQHTSDIKEDEEVVIIFVIHHMIADAKSMSDLMQNQFLPVLSKVLTKSEKSIDVNDLDDSLLDDLNLVKHSIYPCDELANNRVDVNQNISWYLKAALKTASFLGCILKFDKRKPKICISDENDGRHLDGDGYLTGVTPHTLSNNLVTTLRSVGRLHSVALTSILTVALTIALEAVLKERGKPSAGTYSFNIPVDKRRFNSTLMTRPMPLGCYITSFLPKVKPPTTEWIQEKGGEMFWECCRKVQKQISVEMKKLEKSCGGGSGAASKFSQVIRYIADTHTEEHPVGQTMAQFGMSCHFGLSNAGVCDIVNDVPDLEISEEYFTASMGDSNFTSLFITLITSHPGAHINILAIYNHKWLDHLFVDEMFKKLDEILRNENIISNKS